MAREIGCDFKRPMRSMLYVPGSRPEWVRKAAKYGADAVVIDFEDSIPASEVPTARASLLDNVTALREAGQQTVVLRPSAIQHGGMADVDAAVDAEVDVLMIPKADTEVVAQVAQQLDRLDAGTGILPILETPAAIATSHAIACASARNIGLWGGGGARHGDVHLAIGFEWTVGMRESLYISSQVVLHARAAGLHHIIGGAWVNLADLDGLRRHVRRYKALGFTGYVAVHPAQIDVIHDVFRPSAADVEYARKAVAAMEQAEADGLGAVRMEGDMVDYATLRMAERVLRLADEQRH